MRRDHLGIGGLGDRGNRATVTRKYSISAGAERVLVVTAMAPSSTQANQASIASMQLSRWIST